MLFPGTRGSGGLLDLEALGFNRSLHLALGLALSGVQGVPCGVLRHAEIILLHLKRVLALAVRLLMRGERQLGFVHVLRVRDLRGLQLMLLLSQADALVFLAKLVNLQLQLGVCRMDTGRLLSDDPPRCGVHLGMLARDRDRHAIGALAARCGLLLLQ